MKETTLAQLAQYFNTTPNMIIAAICLIALAVIAGVVYAMWLASEESKAERRKFQRIAQASMEAKPWSPPPSGPKGFDRNRRRAA